MPQPETDLRFGEDMQQLEDSIVAKYARKKPAPVGEVQKPVEPVVDVEEEKRIESETPPETLAEKFAKISGLLDRQRDALKTKDMAVHDSFEREITQARTEAWQAVQKDPDLLEEFKRLDAELEQDSTAKRVEAGKNLRPKPENRTPRQKTPERDSSPPIRRVQNDREDGVDLEKVLDEARKKFLSAKRELASVGTARKLLQKVVGSKSQETLEKNLERAEKEYQEARAEFVGINTEKYLAERNKILEAEFKTHLESRDIASKTIGRAYDGYKSLGKYNLELGLQKLGLDVKRGKFIQRAVNVRSVASFGLLGVGIAAGAGSAVGIGAILGRRILAGVSSGVGAYDLTAMGMDKLLRINVEKQVKGREDKLNASSLSNYLSRMETQALMDNKTIEDLRNDKLYTTLLEKYQQKQEAEKQADVGWGGEEHAREMLERRIAEADKDFISKLKDEKLERRFKRIEASLVAAGVGFFVGSGMLAEALGGETAMAEAAAPVETPESPTQPVILEAESPTRLPDGQVGSRDSSPPIRRVQNDRIGEIVREAQQSAKPIYAEVPSELPTEPVELRAGASFEVNEAGSTVIHAGRRGLEGSLIDYAKEMQSADPDKYNQLIETLKEHSPAGADPADPDFLGNSVHRFLVDYAGEHDLDMSELDRIAKGDITFDASGNLELGEVEYLEPAAETPEADSSSAPPQNDNVRTETPVEPKESVILEEPEKATIGSQEDSIASLQSDGSGEAASATEAAAETAVPRDRELARVLADKYEDFLEHFVGIKQGDLYAVKDKSIAQFMETYQENSGDLDYAWRYRGLHKLVSQFTELHGWDENFLKQLKIKKLILDYAKIAKESQLI